MKLEWKSFLEVEATIKLLIWQKSKQTGLAGAPGQRDVYKKEKEWSKDPPYLEEKVSITTRLYSPWKRSLLILHWICFIFLLKKTYPINEWYLNTVKLCFWNKT